MRKYLLKDNENNDLYAIITCNDNIDLEEEIYNIKNKWYEKDIDYSLIEYVKEELEKKYKDIIFDEEIYTMEIIEI